MRHAGLTCLALTLSLMSLAGCSRHLVVRHHDGTNRQAEVRIDGRPVGTVGYREKLEYVLEPGYYRVEARLPGSEESPWHRDRPYCEVVIEDEDAVLTLVPPRGTLAQP